MVSAFYLFTAQKEACRARPACTRFGYRQPARRHQQFSSKQNRFCRWPQSPFTISFFVNAKWTHHHPSTVSTSSATSLGLAFIINVIKVKAIVITYTTRSITDNQVVTSCSFGFPTRSRLRGAFACIESVYYSVFFFFSSSC
jgi:hypothetical protein